jgi:hypothetical protein
MTESDSAPEGLIEVAARTPRDWQPAQLIGSGIFASLTCQLLLRFRNDARLTFDLMPGPRTAMAREFGYRLVEALGGISRKLPDQIAPQRACRSLQRAFAERFVLPRYHVLGSVKSADHRITNDQFDFEATRRVFKFKGDRAPENLLICHVLAQREHRTTERLLVEFVKTVGRGDEPESVRCDTESGLCLWSGSSGHWAGRAYREILIGSPDVLPAVPSDVLPQVQSAPADIGTKPGQQVSDEPRLNDVMPLHEAKGSQSASERDRVEGDDLYAAFDEALYKRSESDWEFVAGQIEEAHKAGRALDERFVETIARQRLELAKTYTYSDRPNAGPTFESSLGIVRSVLNLHLTALKQYEAEEK